LIQKLGGELKTALGEKGKDKQFRYAKALPVQPVCLTCHGDPAAIVTG